jgi:hypothetical protein
MKIEEAIKVIESIGYEVAKHHMFMSWIEYEIEMDLEGYDIYHRDSDEDDDWSFDTGGEVYFRRSKDELIEFARRVTMKVFW